MVYSAAKAVIDWIAAIAMIAVAVFIFVDRPRSRNLAELGGSAAKDAIPREPILIRESASIGSRQAPTAAILFVDFQCPYSRKFAENVWPRFYKDYVEPGKVLFSVHHLPLPMHPDSIDAAAGAECAGRQNKLLAMQDLLFKAPRDQVSVDQVRALGHSLRVDRGKFDECLAGSGKTQVKEDAAGAAEWSVRGTPTIFLGKLDGSQRVRVDFRLDGLPTLERLARVLERRYGV